MNTLMNILTYMLFLICVFGLKVKATTQYLQQKLTLFLAIQGKRVAVGYSCIKIMQKLILYRVWEALSPGIDRIPEARMLKDWLTFSCRTLAMACGFKKCS